MPYLTALLVLCLLATFTAMAKGQMFGTPDRDAPGDPMIQKYLAREVKRLPDLVATDSKSLADWQGRRAECIKEYFYMLGLDPMPEKTPLQAKITGTLRGDGFVVDMLHFQSRPRLYVTGNLYRPADAKPGERFPAVLYLCGHGGMGRNGNKTYYESHGLWFARHGYVCLTLDTVELGEIAGEHHGTYSKGRWWWHSRGYTPAGLECWNGIRGIDYLVGRPDVDAGRIAVTGASGGGAATTWISAADERVKVAVPVSGFSDLECHIPHLVINGHCDCMFMYNTFQWPWTRILGLVAPRPMLFVNSDQDSIFPMDGNERIINRLKRVYSLYGASDSVDCVVSIGGHDYRKDIRQGVYRFINMHLKNDPRVVTDSEVDIASGSHEERRYLIPPEKLRVFPADSDLPKDALNATIDESFVPMAKVELPKKGEFVAWKHGLQDELRRVAFRTFPERIPAAKEVGDGPDGLHLGTEPGIEIPLPLPAGATPEAPKRVLLVVQGTDAAPDAAWIDKVRQDGDAVFIVAPRGIGPTRWTRKDPPNYVERSLVLLGRTADTGRVWDLVAAARWLRAKYDGKAPVHLAGQGAAGVLAAYAALWDEDVAGLVLADPPASHMDAAAPQFLNVLRVCDILDTLGMLAPRPLTILGDSAEPVTKVGQIYAAADAAGSFVRKP